MSLSRTLALAGLAAALGLAPAPSGALDILVTNDDGIASPGIQTLAAALGAAGHDVTVVAPADEQSGKGGSINTDVFGAFVPVARTAANQFAVSGTPSDSVNAALSVLLASDPPDLVVSGLNRGQNLGKLAANTSGTMGAALRAALGAGIPAIAGSVGISIAEQPDFPSTVAAYAPAAAFIVDVIAALEANAAGGELFSKRLNMLNINFPIPHGDWAGAAVTKLGDGSDLALPFFDVTAGFPPFFPALEIAPPCDAVPVGQACLLAVGIAFPPGPDSEQDADVDAHRADLISITPMDGDMTAGSRAAEEIEAALADLL
jgi:alkaline phosphatase D/5'-nucleotidase